MPQALVQVGVPPSTGNDPLGHCSAEALGYAHGLPDRRRETSADFPRTHENEPTEQMARERRNVVSK